MYKYYANAPHCYVARRTTIRPISPGYVLHFDPNIFLVFLFESYRNVGGFFFYYLLFLKTYAYFNGIQNTIVYFYYFLKKYIIVRLY